MDQKQRQLHHPADALRLLTQAVKPFQTVIGPEFRRTLHGAREHVQAAAEAAQAKAEEAQKKAEEAALAAAKYAAAYELAQLQQNGEGLTGHAKEAYDKALADAAAAIEAAKTPAEVDAALAAAREALNNAL